ncbi:MAG: hypothetical protein ACPG8W_05060 [Candidatus Promineifilaceae bacterium]
MLNKQLTLGSAFGTTITIHLSWLWILPLIIGSLVYMQIEPPIEAIVTGLLLFGSVLLATVARLWIANQEKLQWRKVTLFLVGSSVQRDVRSTPTQEMLIETAGLGVNLLLAILFTSLWLALPSGALGIEMEIVAIFNAALIVFGLLLRLSPNHDNLLHAAFAVVFGRTWAHDLIIFFHSVILMLFALSSIFALGFGALAFGWWFAIALMLSQLTMTAEQQGDYRADLPLSASAGLSAESSNSRQKAQI